MIKNGKLSGIWLVYFDFDAMFVGDGVRIELKLLFETTGGLLSGHNYIFNFPLWRLLHLAINQLSTQPPV